ncbi:MAG: flagellar biosynthetic protein FliR [Kofleriaceae bacterium]
MTPIAILVLALRGATAVAVITTFVGGVPRAVQGILAAATGVWTALLLFDGTVPAEFPWELALREVVIGATLGILAAIPLLAAATAGRFVDIAGANRPQGPYTSLFGVLAAAVFVGVDGHIDVIRSILDSHHTLPALATTRVDVLAALGQLLPAAVRLAVPWLVTAAIVQLAIGAGTRIAARASANIPGAVAVPAALVMMTASLVATLAVAIAALVRHTL